MRPDWPKAITEWSEGGTGYLSVPFTWLLPDARERILQRDLFVNRWIVGGPAVKLMPEYLADTPAEIRGEMPGVLQRVNPMATRTTLGCPNHCKFCGIGQRKIEGCFAELDDWPDLPILCDNNLLAASMGHFKRVIARLERWSWCDFNQGIDCRLLTSDHAPLIARVKKPIVRMALDTDGLRDTWAAAFERLRSAGVAKNAIRSYVLCGFAGSPEADWDRCRWVESFKVKALPMWFHRLDCLCYGEVTNDQRRMGWTGPKQKELMRWFYRHSTKEIDWSKP